LLGKVIDKFAAMPFTDFIAQRQFIKAGMTNTAFGDSYHLVHHRAPAWRWDGRGHLPAFDQFPDYLLTGAGINSSARELAQWLISLQQEKLISKTSLALLWRAGTFNNGRPAPWALGWPVIRDGDLLTVGGIGGARSAFFVYPNHGLAVVMLTNLRGGAPEELIDAVAARIVPAMRGKIDGNYTAYLLRERMKTGAYDSVGTLLGQMQKSGMADPREEYLNSWAYRLSRKKQHQEALAIFRLATKLYPLSANAHDSLAEGLEAAGQPVAAAQAYKDSLVLDPANTHAIERLKAISGTQ
jgi:CubicO group peptidase (beta-lactamase class C family)